jgi:hypothetical protein
LFSSPFFYIFAKNVDIMAFRKSIKARDIKDGDDIVVYYHSSPSAKAVRPLYFHVDEIRGSQLECTRIKKDGTTFKDAYYETQKVRFTRNKKNDILETRSYSYWSPYNGGTYYLDPDIPCGLVINRLMEEKKKINKTIVDCQHLMYAVENDI